MADGIDHLVFLGRDGYFLKENFEYLEKLSGERVLQICYLETSRQILMCVCMESEEDFLDYVRFPYRGCIGNYVEDRFGVKLKEEDMIQYGDRLIDAAEDYHMLIELLQPYMDVVKDNIIRNKKYYREYLEGILYDGGLIR